MIGLLEFHIAHSELLLPACADQLLFNLSLINYISAYAKQNPTLKSTSNACFLFIVRKIDVIWSSRTTPEFINYQLWTSYKTFLSCKYLFRFFLNNGWHIFTRVLNQNCMFLLCHVRDSEWIHYLRQAQYLKFKWRITSWKYSRSNIVQKSSLCYVAGF